MTRLLLADDHPILLEGLASLLIASNFDVVGRFGNGRDAHAAFGEMDPDIAILDINMPGKSGLDILREHRSFGALRPKIVILTATTDPQQMVEVLDLEPDGLVLKEAVVDRIVYCLEKIVAGVQWIENDALLMAMRRLAHRETVTNRTDRLTAREREIAKLVVTGLNNRDIAAALGIAESTVKMHLGAIFEKLGVASRTQLAAFVRDTFLAK